MGTLPQFARLAVLVGVMAVGVAVLPALASAAPSVSAVRAATFDVSHSQEIFTKGAGVAANASTTKLMTLAVVADALNQNEVSLDDKFLVSDYSAGDPLNPLCNCFPNFSPKVLTGGEQITLRDALYGVAESANDMTGSVAEFVANAHIFGVKATGNFNHVLSQALTHGFVQMMNAKAAALGLAATHFTSPQGYDDQFHYTTPSDLNKLYHALAGDPILTQFFGMRQQVVNITDPDGFAAWSVAPNCTQTGAITIQCTLTKSYKYFPGIDADKSGKTTNCIHCLVAQSTRIGHSLIGSVLQSQDEHADVANMFQDGFAQILKPKRTGSSGVSGGAASASAFTYLGGFGEGFNTQTSVSAAVTPAGMLTVTGWHSNVPGGVLVKAGESSLMAPASGADAVEIAVARFDTVVTAIHTPANTIELRTWHIDPSGQPSPKALVVKLPGGRVALAGLYGPPGAASPGLFASAVANNGSAVTVRLWKVAPDESVSAAGQWVSPYSVDGSELALAGDAGSVMNIAKSPRLVLAERLFGGKLRVVLFGAAVDSGALSQFLQADAGVGSSIALTHIGQGSFATSMVTAKGNLEVDFWRTNVKGQIWSAGDSGSQVEAAVETAIAPVGPGNKEGVVTATRTPGHQLKLIVWENDERGDNVSKTFLKLAENGADGGAVDSGIEIRALPGAGLGDLVTAGRASGVLQLASWQVGA